MFQGMMVQFKVSNSTFRVHSLYQHVLYYKLFKGFEGRV